MIAFLFENIDSELIFNSIRAEKWNSNAFKENRVLSYQENRQKYIYICCDEKLHFFLYLLVCFQCLVQLLEINFSEYLWIYRSMFDHKFRWLTLWLLVCNTYIYFVFYYYLKHNNLIDIPLSVSYIRHSIQSYFRFSEKMMWNNGNHFIRQKQRMN